MRDPREQMEQMVLQYVRAHGRIARREVMELLCDLFDAIVNAL